MCTMICKKMSHYHRNKPRFFYGYFVVGTSLLMISVIWAVYFAFGVFFKPMLNEFGWTRAVISGALSLAVMMSGLLTIAMGGLTDRVGPRTVMTLCGLFLGSGFILMSQVRTLSHLYLFYGILVGVGMGGSFVPLISTVVRWFVKRRGLMTGIVAAGTGVGTLIGPPVASRLIPIYGWRASYALLGGILMAVVVLFAQFTKRDPDQVGQIPYGQNQKDQTKLNSIVEGLSLREAVCTLQFWVFSGVVFCYGYCVYAIMVHIVPHATELGISAIRAASILATIGGLGILGKVLLGRLGDFIGNKPIIILGFILMSVASIWLISAKTQWMLFSIASIFGFGYGGSTVSQSPLIAELFGLRAHGLIFGVFSVSVMSGGAVGPLLTGYIFDVTNSYKVAFLFCAIVVFAGILFSTFLKTERK
jgi:OFA family oxalate/formate antiporter-like MFS transporter